MTTFTSADQAGGEAEAQVSGIPAQRSGQALRLLVLGAGTSVDAVRELATAAGAEIAQRFSNRVTHVVVDESVGAEDPRVARARTAGVPVLGVDEVAALVGRPDGSAGVGERDSVESAGDARATAVTAAAVASSAGDVGGGGLASADGASAGGEVGAGPALELELELEGGVRRSAVVDSAAGLGGSETYGQSVGRVEVKVGVLGSSPLESALVFPPLPAEVIRDGAAVDEEAREEEEAAANARGRETARGEGEREAAAKSWADPEAESESESEAEAGAEGEARVESEADGVVGVGDVTVPAQARGWVGAESEVAGVVGTAGAVDGGAEAVGQVGAESLAESESPAEGEAQVAAPAQVVGGKISGAEISGGKTGSDESVSVEAGLETEDSAGPDQSVEAPMSAATTAVSLAWAVVPLVSIGLLTPVSLGYAAYRLRSRKLAAATAWYTVAVSVAFAISATHPSASDARTSAASGGVVTACLAASWVGGTIHSFLIRRRVFR